MIDIGIVTSALLEHLPAAMLPLVYPVGDGVAPEKAGWPDGSPNTRTRFVPYFVLKYSGAVGSLITDTPLCTTYATRFAINYSLVSYDNDRVLADSMASVGRKALNNLGEMNDQQCGDLLARFHHIFIDSMSGAARDDSVFPKMWSAATNFRLDVARKPLP